MINNLSKKSFILFLISIMVFPRSFVFLKIAFLFFFLAFNVLEMFLKKRNVYIHLNIFIFYLAVCVTGILWSLIGHANNANFQGIEDALRLYVIWSVAYFVIITIVRNNREINDIHISIVLSGLIISIINIFGFIDFYYSMNIIPYAISKQLDMFVGVHDTYIQITSHNIGPLFFIFPYMICYLSFKDVKLLKSKVFLFSIVLCAITIVISGRRGLWIVVVLCPIFIYLFCLISNRDQTLKPMIKIIVTSYLSALILILIAFSVGSAFELNLPFIDYIQLAFSKEDERTIQLEYLLNKFFESPIIGSGFGVGAGYIRNYERPWIYELTYFQLLYNLGLLGFSFWAIYISFLYLKVLKTIKRSLNFFVLPVAFLVGLVSFFIGTYSNPYLGSFDFLIYLAFLPLLTSFDSESNV